MGTLAVIVRVDSEGGMPRPAGFVTLPVDVIVHFAVGVGSYVPPQVTVPVE